MKRKQILSLVLASLMISGTLLYGCGKKAEVNTDSKPTNNESTYSDSKILDYYVGEEPETLDCQKMTGAPDMFVANMFIEGLTRFGKEEGKYIPGVAKSWKFDETSNTWTFELRDNAKWMDGTPVTSKDFLFGWKVALDENAQYSSMLTGYIEGAAEYAALTQETFLSSKDPAFKALVDQRDKEKDKDKKKTLAGQVSDKLKTMPDNLKTEFKKNKDDLWSKIGVKANTDNVQIKLSSPCPYFLGLTAFPVYYPVNEKFYEQHKKANDYCLEDSGLNCNGPWIMKEWKHKDNFKLEKNPNYWNKGEIKIDKINIKIVTDVSTRTNLLKTGAIDGSAIQSDDIKVFNDKAVRDQYHLQDMVDMPDYTIFYLEFNHFNNPITMNKNIRKAISCALDRKGLTEKIFQGDMPAFAYIPEFFPGLNKAFREENGKILLDDNNKDKAKEFLQKGLQELKMDKLPPQDILIGQSDISKKYGEKIQSDLKEIGIDINLVPVTWGDKLGRLKNGNFGICASGWGPDYLDPMTFLDLFESKNGNNHGQYNNPKYDELINNAIKEKNSKKRMSYLYDAEKHLIEEMAIVPHYDRTAHGVYRDYLTDVVNRGAGPSTDFYFADIDMNKKMEQLKK